MHPYPHHYRVTATATAQGEVATGSGSLPPLAVMSPPEFDGPEGFWSPETLLAAAVSDCLVLTFRAIARASKFEWRALHCETEAVLERVGGNSQFTRFISRVRLEVPAGTDEARARQLLEKAERGCLVANSLNGARELVAEIVIVN
jgi:organic hydroperoxide reductase OsmC/OhrA